MTISDIIPYAAGLAILLLMAVTLLALHTGRITERQAAENLAAIAQVRASLRRIVP